MFECVTDPMLENILKPWAEFLKKLHIHIRSKCCCDCVDVVVNVFQRTNSRHPISSL